MVGICYLSKHRLKNSDVHDSRIRVRIIDRIETVMKRAYQVSAYRIVPVACIVMVIGAK